MILTIKTIIIIRTRCINAKFIFTFYSNVTEIKISKISFLAKEDIPKCKNSMKKKKCVSSIKVAIKINRII